MLGVPFMYTESIRLKEQLNFLEQEYNIKEFYFLIFDECLCRVLRNKTDYWLMIMAPKFGFFTTFV